MTEIASASKLNPSPLARDLGIWDLGEIMGSGEDWEIGDLGRIEDSIRGWGGVMMLHPPPLSPP